MSDKNPEGVFLTAFEDLIDTYAKQPLQGNNFKENSPSELFAKLVDAKEIRITFKASQDDNHSNSGYLDKKFSGFIEILEKTEFKYGLIPYDKITECVFENTPEEIIHSFTNALKSQGEKYFSSNEKQDENFQRNKKAFFKIIRHIDLAIIQKYNFANLKIKEVEVLKRDYELLNKQHEELKIEADKQYKRMLTQFITILGIFAAILMGAFGALQGFTSLFDNAHRLDLSTILIISSIGASSVILILFFLLNAIAKLTDRSLSNTYEKDSSLIEAYPAVVVIYGLLILVALIGAALELSNTPIYYSLQGFWWAVPVIWLIYMGIAFNKKRLWPLWPIKDLTKLRIKIYKSEKDKKGEEKDPPGSISV